MKFTRSQAVTSDVYIQIFSQLEGRNKWELMSLAKEPVLMLKERNSVGVVFPIIIVIYYTSHVTPFVEQSLWNVFKQWILGKLMQQLSDITVVKIFIHVFKPTRFPSHDDAIVTLLPQPAPIVLTIFIISQKCCLSTEYSNMCHVCKRNVDC